MQGTVVMLLALSGLGCHHKSCAPVVASSCYSSCYSSGCYSSSYGGGCYSAIETSCYSSYSSGCYSSSYGGGCYSSCYSGGGCYSSCYSAPRHRHGLFGCKRKACGACYAPAPAPVAACDPCMGGSGYPPVYGTYTPVYEGYASSQYPTSQAPMMAPSPTMQAPTPAPTTPEPAPAPTPAPAPPAAPSPGNPAPTPAPAVPGI